MKLTLQIVKNPLFKIRIHSKSLLKFEIEEIVVYPANIAMLSHYISKVSASKRHPEVRPRGSESLQNLNMNETINQHCFENDKLL